MPHIWASNRISQIQDNWLTIIFQASPINMKIRTIKHENDSTHTSHLGLQEDVSYLRWMVSCYSSLTYRHENWDYKRWEQLHPFLTFGPLRGFLITKMDGFLLLYSSLTNIHENWNYKRWEQLHPYPIFELSMGFLTSKMTHCFSSLIHKYEKWDCKKWDTTNSKPLGSIILSGKSRIIVRL